MSNVDRSLAYDAWAERANRESAPIGATDLFALSAELRAEQAMADRLASALRNLLGYVRDGRRGVDFEGTPAVLEDYLKRATGRAPRT